MNQRRWLHDLFWPIGLASSVVWAAVMVLRRTLGRRRFTSRLSVLCVGNLHSGGSGKTPLVAEIVKRYGTERAVVVTRGYGGRRERLNEFIDPAHADGAREYGDEAWWLATACRAKVLVGKRRRASLKLLEAQYPNSAVILDDGFQHLAVRAKVSVVLIKTARHPTESFCLPWGDLREPYSSLKDAQAVVFVTDEESTGLATWEHFFEHSFPILPRFVVREVPNGLWDGETRLEKAPSRLGGFCGVGVPNTFIRRLRALGGEILQVFPDHHPYGARDIETILERQKAGALEALVTTEKDWVKLGACFAGRGARLLTLRIRHEIPEEFWYFLETRWVAR